MGWAKWTTSCRALGTENIQRGRCWRGCCRLALRLQWLETLRPTDSRTSRARSRAWCGAGLAITTPYWLRATATCWATAPAAAIRFAERALWVTSLEARALRCTQGG